MLAARAAAPRITGEPSAKSTITVADAPAGARIQWTLADKEAGPYVPLQGVTGGRMVLPAVFTGKWARAQVTGANGKVEETAPVAIRGVVGNPNIAFMHKNGWGLSFTFDREYIQRGAANDAERIGKKPDGSEESWDETLASFDVEAFAKEVESTGADFVLLALGQNSGYYCAPNATMEKLIGCAPNTYCSKRDLPMEIMKALKPRGIAVMLYLPGNPPVHNRTVRDGLKWFGHGNDSPSQETVAHWDAVIEEWAKRYGADLAGWWMDGMYDHKCYAMDQEHNWHTRAAAMKAGNPACAISLGGCRPSGSHYEDYFNGETLGFGAEPADGQWKNVNQATQALEPAKRGDFPGPWWIGGERRMQWLSYTTVGIPLGGYGAWGNKGCSRQPEALDSWMKKVRAKGGVVMLDGKVSRLGHIDPDQLKLYLATPACHDK
jgi:hypothetical protein